METRDYGDLSRRLDTLSSSESRYVEKAGSVEGYPVHVIRLQSNASSVRSILITAGVHGDEPAGIEAVIGFLERDNTDLLQHFRFCAIPCVNPTGYVDNSRENRLGIDINRSFEKDNIPEVQIVKQVIRGRQFDFFVDFHEDWEAGGFYLYEGRRDGHGMGEEIIRAVKSIGPIDPDSDPDDPPISHGLYRVATAWGTQGFAPYILKFHAPHVLMPETPTGWAMDRRAAAHLAVLDTVLAHYQD